MRRALAIPLAYALATLLGACTPVGSPAPTPSPSAAPVGTACSVDQVRRLVSDFVTAYDAGGTGLVDRFFAAAPDFQWYSEDATRKGSAAFDRGTLETYLAQRHTDGDRLSFVSVTMSGSRDPNVGNFGFVVRRGQVDLPSKGAIDCRSGKFVVWSLGPNAGP